MVTSIKDFSKKASKSTQTSCIHLAQKNQWDKVYNNLSHGFEMLTELSTPILASYISNYLKSYYKNSKQGQENEQFIKKICDEFLGANDQASLLEGFTYNHPHYFSLISSPKIEEKEFITPFIDALASLSRNGKYANIWMCLKKDNWSPSWKEYLDVHFNEVDSNLIWQSNTKISYLPKELGKTSWLQIFSALQDIWNTQDQNIKISEKTLLGLSLTKHRWAGTKLLIEEGGSITKCGCDLKIKNILSGKTIPKINRDFSYEGEEEKLNWVVDHIKSQYEKIKIMDQVEITVTKTKIPKIL